MNQWTVTGNVTRKPEMRESAKGKHITRFSIAVDRPFADDKTDFFVFTAFADLAVRASKLNVGDRILVQAYVKNNIYEKDGQKIYAIDFIATNFEYQRKKK